MKYQDKALRVAMGVVQLQPCVLCGQKSDGCGVYVPTDSVQFGGTNGQQRVIVYSLCSTCQKSPGAHERVEALLASRYRGDAA
jgi:hypothetical protein